MKSSKSKTQHDIHKIYSHFIKTLSNKSHTQDEVYGKKGELSDHLFKNVTFFGKDFSFVVNSVKSNKLETQYVIHKIYSHFIETPPSKSETHHEVHIV